MSKTMTDRNAKIGKISKRGRVFGMLAFIVFCVVLSYLAYFFWDRTQRLDASFAKELDQVAMRLDLVNDQIEALTEKLDDLIFDHDTLVSVVQQNRATLSGSSVTLALSEVEYLLVIAEQKLLFQNDPANAQAAMEAAEARLSALHEPALVNVRSQLISDLHQLTAIRKADVTGLALSLSDFLDIVDELPLRQEIVPSDNTDALEADQSEQSGFGKRFWTALQVFNILHITRDDDTNPPARLLPNEAYFIYQNLRLELASARFSVLQRDTDNFRRSLDLISQWLRQYFEIRQPMVENMMDTLDEMKVVELNDEIPNIAASLESVRAYIRGMDVSYPQDH